MLPSGLTGPWAVNSMPPPLVAQEKGWPISGKPVSIMVRMVYFPVVVNWLINAPSLANSESSTL
ncbi:hypothetical protein D3C72_2370760 [compost metagenome]